MCCAHAQLETRLPVIARVEVLYSMVSHYPRGDARGGAFYSVNGDPPGTQYAIPYLVYEPIVTLYNPYNTDLVLPKSRVLIANPPVGFKFRKNDDYLRAEWNNGGPFLGLGRFQTANESNVNVEKTITLLLSSKAFWQPGSIRLRPGEAQSFAVAVEDEWTWALETRFPVSRAFFDHDPVRDLTNKDGRTNNSFGVETVRGSEYGMFREYVLDFRGGFQTDALSVSSGRPAATRFPFETGTYGTTSWVAMRMLDTIRVEAKGVDTVLNPAVPDFHVSLLRGIDKDPADDTAKSYSFHIDDLVQPETTDPDAPVIDRTFSISSLLQNDSSAGGKTLIASFLMVAKSTALQQKKFLADVQPPSNELYEVRLIERRHGVPLVPDGPSDHPTGGVVVTGIERVGDFVVLDVAAQPWNGSGPLPWKKIVGGIDPGAGLTDELTPWTSFELGPQGAGIYKFRVPVPPSSEKYFVQIAY